METVIVESTVLVEQKPLTKMQFYLLQTTILVETTVLVEQKTLTTITVVACIFSRVPSRVYKATASRCIVL